MNRIKFLALEVATAGIALMLIAPRVKAQVTEVDGRSLDERGNLIGAPTCPYGYYDYDPYSCAPYGYYGPEWFKDGIFLGAAKWFHGPANFNGRVDNRLDPNHGYKGSMPSVGDKRDPSKRLDNIPSFQANEVRDGRGHVMKGKH